MDPQSSSLSPSTHPSSDPYPPLPHSVLQQQQQQQAHPPQPSHIPPIAQLLYREGDAWTSVLSLHSGVLGAVQRVNANLQTTHPLSYDTERELQYCASLSNAAAQCDVLHAEIIKLRHLRKSRTQFDLAILQPLFQSHIHETLATGSSLASQASISLQSVSSEVRNAIQETKRVESELTELHDLLSSFPATTIPSDITVGIGSSHLPLRDFVSILRKHASNLPASSNSSNASNAPNSPSTNLDVASILRDCAFHGNANSSSSLSSSSPSAATATAAASTQASLPLPSVEAGSADVADASLPSTRFSSSPSHDPLSADQVEREAGSSSAASKNTPVPVRRHGDKAMMMMTPR